MTARLWVVLKWTEAELIHGRAGAYWLRANTWTTNSDEACRMPKAEAERMAGDWTSYAVTKGRPERYRATQEPQP